jgi:hypothetical protein
MALRVRRKVFDFLAKNYDGPHSKLQILPKDFDHSKFEAQPKNTKNFIARWYLSLQGDDSPIVSSAIVSQENKSEQHIYRYDWAFGISAIRDFWWNWLGALCKEGALAVHLVLEPKGDVPEAVPVSATLSALRPSRNTKGFWESEPSIIPRAAADMAKKGSPAFSPLEYVSSGLMLTSNILDSYTENKKTKNWFLYQFLDEDAKSPTIEWRINRQVFKECGPLLRGTLYLAFHGSTELHPGSIRILLRPQVRYYEKNELDFIAPTKEFAEDEQVFLDVKPKEVKP